MLRVYDDIFTVYHYASNNTRGKPVKHSFEENCLLTFCIHRINLHEGFTQ